MSGHDLGVGDQRQFRASLKDLMEETDTFQKFILGLYGMDSSFHVRWHLVYLTDLKVSIVAHMYLTCLGGWGWDRHCSFLPNGHSLLFLVHLTRRLRRTDTFLALPVASSA